MIGNSRSEYVFIRICIFVLQYTTPICLACLAVLVAVNHHQHGHGDPDPDRDAAAATLKETLTSYLSSSLAASLLLGYAALDLLYAVFVWTPHSRRLREDAADHPPPLPRARRRALLERCLIHIPDTERYLRMWCLGADAREIRRDNLRDFLLWAFFDRRPRPRAGSETGEDEDEEELEEYIALIERNLGRKIEPGRGTAESVRLTLDKVEARYRSVIWYIIIGIVDLVTHCQMAWCGFEYHAQPRSAFLSVIPHRVQSLSAGRRSAALDLAYWHRPHTAKDKLPVVFLHGIGVGLWTYVSFLSSLNDGAGRDEQIGIIAIEYLPISFRLTGTPLPKAEFLRQVAAILESHGWDRFVLAAHSYGSVLATHMFQSEMLGTRIESIMLIDPVSILLHLPDVAVNFTRRKPQRANEWMLWYFASMDPGVAHCLGRYFFWKDNIAWKEDLVNAVGIPSVDMSVISGKVFAKQTSIERKRRVAVCLAENDLIVNTLTVAQYLAGDEEWYSASTGASTGAGKTTSHRRPDRGHVTEDGIELLWFPGLDHAQVFDAGETRARLCSVLQRYCAK